MDKLHQFKKELNSQPIKMLAIALMTIVIVILAFTVTAISAPEIKTVTSYEECVEVGGNVEGRVCEIGEQEFTGPIRIQIPRSR